LTLPPDEARLRAEATRHLAQAARRLDDGSFGYDSAFREALHGRPGKALQWIERAEGHLRKAKAALRKWRKAGR